MLRNQAYLLNNNNKKRYKCRPSDKSLECNYCVTKQDQTIPIGLL